MRASEQRVVVSSCSHRNPRLNPLLPPSFPSCPCVHHASIFGCSLSLLAGVQQFHRDLPPSRVFAFGATPESASVPGPTIVVTAGRTLKVRWHNNITASEHIFPVDDTLGVPRVAGVPMGECRAAQRTERRAVLGFFEAPHNSGGRRAHG